LLKPKKDIKIERDQQIGQVGAFAYEKISENDG